MEKLEIRGAHSKYHLVLRTPFNPLRANPPKMVKHTQTKDKDEILKTGNW